MVAAHPIVTPITNGLSGVWDLGLQRARRTAAPSRSSGLQTWGTTHAPNTATWSRGSHRRVQQGMTFRHRDRALRGGNWQGSSARAATTIRRGRSARACAHRPPMQRAHEVAGTLWRASSGSQQRGGGGGWGAARVSRRHTKIPPSEMRCDGGGKQVPVAPHSARRPLLPPNPPRARHPLQQADYERLWGERAAPWAHLQRHPGEPTPPRLP